MNKRKPYIKKPGFTWWLQKKEYFFYMLRESTAVAVLCFALILLQMVVKHSQGPVAYHEFLSQFSSWFWKVAIIIMGLASLIHTISWFNVAPKSVNLYVGNKKLEDWKIIAGNWLVFIGASVFVWVYLLGLI